MNGYQGEPRLSDALADPIVRIIMTADHVDPQALEACLRQTARRMGQRSTRQEQTL